MVEHLRNKNGNAKKRAWVGELLALGMQPILQVINDKLTEQEAYDAERRLIREHCESGLPLVNYQNTNLHIPYQYKEKLTGVYVVWDEKDYERHKSLGHHVVYTWEERKHNQSQA